MTNSDKNLTPPPTLSTSTILLIIGWLAIVGCLLFVAIWVVLRSAPNAPSEVNLLPANEEKSILAEKLSERPVEPISPGNISQIGEFGVLGYGIPTKTAWSPDGKRLAVLTSQGIYLYNAQTFKPEQVVAIYGYPSSLAFTPDGQTVAVGTAEGVVWLWTVDGQSLSTLKAGEYITSLAFSEDGKTLAVGSGSVVRVWQTNETWSFDAAQELLSFKKHKKFVTSVTFCWACAVQDSASAENGPVLASASEDGKIIVWRAYKEGPFNQPPLYYTLETNAGMVESMTFSPDGTKLANSAIDGGVQVRNTADGSLLESLMVYKGAAPKDNIYSLAFSPDGESLVAGGEDKTLRIWRLGKKDGTPAIIVSIMKGHQDSIRDVAFSPDGQMLVSVADDASVRIWRVSDGKQMKKLDGYLGAVHSVAVSSDGRWLASGSINGTALLWDMNSRDGYAALMDGGLEPARSLAGALRDVDCITFSPDGQHVAACAGDTTLRLWRIEDGDLDVVRTTHDYPIRSVAFSPNGQLLATGSEDNDWKVFLVNSNGANKTVEWLYTLGEPIQPDYNVTFSNVAFSADGKFLAAGSSDKTVRLWQTESFATRKTAGESGSIPPFKTLRGPDEVTGLAFSANGSLLTAGFGNGRLSAWQVLSWNPLFATLRTHIGGARTIAFSPDGQLIATSGFGGEIKFWHATNGKLLATLAGHKSVRVPLATGERRIENAITGLAFSPTGLYLASSSYDGTIHLWAVGK